MFELGALELSSEIKSKKISVNEAVSAYLKSITGNNNQYNAFITVLEEKALIDAEKIQQRINKGENISPLAGVPVAVKDNICTMGIETTCASKMLKGYRPVFNASVIEKMEEAGMILIGKLNMDEFAMGRTGRQSAFGDVKNPWNTSLVTGGSSSGSAAAVAGMEAPLSLGTDTGGSIRNPCAYCGLTGIKPSYGSVSRYGLVAHASSLDQIGPMGKNIDDAAALLEIISGPDEKDNTCIMNTAFDFDIAGQKKNNADGKPLSNIKIGLPINLFDSNMSDEVRNSIMNAAKEFENRGAIMEEFEMPLKDYFIPVYISISAAEAYSNLSRFDGLKYGYRNKDAKDLSELYSLSRGEGFGMEVKKRIMLGSMILSSENYDLYYRKAMQIRTLIINSYKDLFKKYDVILSPVSFTTAYKPEEVSDTRIFNVSANLAGLPALALPCGLDNKGLPIGFQLTGKAFSESLLINSARVYQNCTIHHTERPGAKR